MGESAKVESEVIFGEITKWEVFVDLYSVTDISEVVCEFNVGR